MIFTANKLWYDGELAVGMCPAPFNCELLVGATPRDAFLVPSGGNCGVPDYNLSLSRPNPYPSATLQGVWLELRGGKGMMIDAISAQDVIAACDACCGAAPVIAPRYDGTLPSPPPPVAATYQFTRTDYGDWYAYNKASLDYWDQYISGTFNRVSYVAGVSTYSLQAYKDPIWIAGDTVTSETPRLFVSNVAPTLIGTNVYNMTVTINGVNLSPILTGATVAALQTALSGNATYSALGTWTVVGGNTIQLSSTTVDLAQLVIGQQAP